jgi:hypothetical protein
VKKLLTASLQAINMPFTRDQVILDNLPNNYNKVSAQPAKEISYINIYRDALQSQNFAPLLSGNINLKMTPITPSGSFISSVGPDGSTLHRIA